MTYLPFLKGHQQFSFVDVIACYVKATSERELGDEFEAKQL